MSDDNASTVTAVPDRALVVGRSHPLAENAVGETNGPRRNPEGAGGQQRSQKATESMISLQDSAYESRAPSFISISSNLRVFQKVVDAATRSRFDEVRPEIEKIVRMQIRSTGAAMIVIRLVVLGNDEANATPHIVVLCPPSQCKRIRKFFNSTLGKEICEPADDTIPRLKWVVYGRAPQPKSAQLGIEARYH